MRVWMRTLQVMVIPISEASADYALDVRKALREAHFFVDVDIADNKMQKKVREAQLAQYNYILVCSPLFNFHDAIMPLIKHLPFTTLGHCHNL
jgi:threonyl-tRNA synthetase